MELRLRQWRQRRGWSLRVLGEKSGVAYPTIQRIEAGRLTPRLSTLERLAAALGVGVRDLIPATPRTPRRGGRR